MQSHLSAQDFTAVEPGKPTLLSVRTLGEKPPAAAVSLAESVFTLMAAHETIKPIVRAYQSRILSEMQAPPDARWTDATKKRHLPKAPILDPESSYLLSDVDSETYFLLCEEAAENAKVPFRGPGLCPLSQVETLLRKAEHALLEAVEPYTGIKLDSVLARMELRKGLLEIVLKILVNHCDPHKRFNLPAGGPASEG